MRQLFITLLTPLAKHLANVNPSTLTVISLIAGVLAGVAYGFTNTEPIFYILGAVLAAFSGIADSLDGIVARMHGRDSKFGDFLDHFCDRVVDVSILAGLAVSPRANSTLGLSVIIMVLLHNYLVTQIQASFGKRFYGGAGKPELFIALIGFSVFLAFFPDATLRIAGKPLALINILFVILGVAAVAGVIHRFFNVHIMCSANIKKGKNDT